MCSRHVRVPPLRNSPLDGKDMTDLEQFTMVPPFERPTIRGQDFKPVETVVL